MNESELKQLLNKLPQQRFEHAENYIRAYVIEMGHLGKISRYFGARIVGQADDADFTIYAIECSTTYFVAMKNN